MQPSPPALPRRQCRHCGTPFAPRHEGEHFCCSGCEAVSTLIQTQGLSHFYDLRQGISAPVGERGLEPRDFNWLQTLAMQAEADARTATNPSAARTAATASAPSGTIAVHAETDAVHAEADTRATPESGTSTAAAAILALPIAGIHCTGCRWLIDQLFTQQPNADTCALDAQGQYIRFTWQLPESDGQPHFDARAFANLLLAFGYVLENPALPRDAGQQGNTPANTPAGARKRLMPRLLLCGVFALNAVMFSLPTRLGASIEDFPFLRLFGLLVFLCATLATGLAASYFWQAATLHTGEANNSDDTETTRQTHTVAKPRGHFGPHRLLALTLILLCVLSFIAPSFALPPIFAADTVAATSFAALLIAFVAKR